MIYFQLKIILRRPYNRFAQFKIEKLIQYEKRYAQFDQRAVSKQSITEFESLPPPAPPHQPFETKNQRETHSQSAMDVTSSSRASPRDLSADGMEALKK